MSRNHQSKTAQQNSDAHEDHLDFALDDDTSAISDQPGADHDFARGFNDSDPDMELDSEENPQPQGENGGSLLFGGIKPFTHWYFSDFFRQLLRGGYSDDNDAQAQITAAANKAATTGWTYMLIRKTCFFAILAAIAIASLDGMVFQTNGAEFVAKLPGAGSPTGFFLIISTIGILVSIASAAIIGRIFDFVIGDLRGNLINEVTGQCGKLNQQAHKCFRAIYSENADYPSYEETSQSEWPRKAKRYFLSGHRHAKRLQFLEVFVLIETRRVVTHYRIIDAVSLGVNAIIVAALLTFLIIQSDNLTVSLWMAAISTLLIGAVWTFWGARSDDTFSHDVLKAVVEGYHSFAKFSLEDEIGDIIRRDQVKIIELTGKLARR